MTRKELVEKVLAVGTDDTEIVDSFESQIYPYHEVVFTKDSRGIDVIALIVGENTIGAISFEEREVEEEEDE